MRSLVVEDDFVCRKLLSLLLRSYGECDIASDGLEALEAVKMASEEGWHYDLICLDIQMPNLDGQGCLKAIRENEKSNGFALGHGSKVVMTTALEDKDNVFAAFRQNADGYLTKPILRAPLEEMLDRLNLNYEKVRNSGS